MSCDDKKNLMKLYETMSLIRNFENTVGAAYAKGAMPGEMHLYNGQEGIAAGVCTQLRATDAVTSTHRAHGELIAKGVDLKKMTAELFGRTTGLCKGHGGHMHLFDASLKFSCSGIVGASMPPAIGAAFAYKYKKEDNVAVAFFGDGAANQGTFHESMNMAALWNLPIIFVCIDNGFGISVRQHESTSTKDSIKRAEGYGIEGKLIDGNDVLAVYEAAEAAIKKARSGGGPSYIECKTYRLRGHFEGDPEVYKTAEEQEAGLKNEPISRFKEYLKNNCQVTEEEFDTVEERIKNQIQEAFKFAEESPWPKPEQALENVFIEGSAV